MTTEVYEALVETVIPQMNRPVTHAQFGALLDDAQIKDDAKTIGLQDWVASQPKLLTRKALVERLWAEPEFQQLWRQQAQTSLQPAWRAIPDLAKLQAPKAQPIDPADHNTEQ